MLNYTRTPPTHYYLEYSGRAAYMETHPTPRDLPGHRSIAVKVTADRRWLRERTPQHRKSAVEFHSIPILQSNINVYCVRVSQSPTDLVFPCAGGVREASAAPPAPSFPCKTSTKFHNTKHAGPATLTESHM